MNPQQAINKLVRLGYSQEVAVIMKDAYIRGQTDMNKYLVVYKIYNEVYSMNVYAQDNQNAQEAFEIFCVDTHGLINWPFVEIISFTIPY